MQNKALQDQIPLPLPKPKAQNANLSPSVASEPNIPAQPNNSSSLQQSLGDLTIDENSLLEKTPTSPSCKLVSQGYVLINEAHKIIGVCKDSFDEVLYLVAFKETLSEQFEPQWIPSWIANKIYPQLID